MSEDKRRDIALMRYGAISPLIVGLSDEYKNPQEFFRAVEKKGIPHPNGEIKHYDVSTLFRWHQRYKKYGFDGLMPSNRADLGISRVLDDDIKSQIEYLVNTYPRMSSVSIYDHLQKNGLIKYQDMSVSTIRRYVKKIKTSSKQTNHKDMRRYEREHINEVWCGDSSVGPRFIDENGERCRVYIIALIDDASRFITGADIFYHDNYVNLMSVIKSAVLKYGRPKVFNFDNGKAYRNKQMELLAARIGTTLNYCEPYTPTSKSKIERWFRTMKDQWMATINTKDYESIEQLRESLHVYVQKYNQTIHKSLNNQTPQDRFFSEPEHIKRLNEREIETGFLLEIERKVSADNVIIINQKEYEVNYRYAKQKIKLRYSHDLKEVYIVEPDGALEPIKLLNKHDNAHIKREKIRLTQGD